MKISEFLTSKRQYLQAAVSKQEAISIIKREWVKMGGKAELFDQTIRDKTWKFHLGISQ